MIMSAVAATANVPYSPGLEGIVAGETAVSTVEDGLRYRGYTVGELVDHCTFDEVAYLLIYGDLPNAAELEGFQQRVAMARRLPNAVKELFAALPKFTTPLDALRTAVSALSGYDQDAADNSTEANQRKAERLLAQMPVAVADFARINAGLQPVMARPDLGSTANFLYMFTGAVPSAETVKALDVSLTLYAEHEFNASTFTGRVIVSTLSDLHSGVVGAIGALKGPLHGGANEKVMDVVKSAGGPATAEQWTLDALARKERIMGFGHRVYKTGDVRAGIIKPYVRAAADAAGHGHWEDTADVIESVMAREKTMYPNVDWPAGRLYHAMNLPIPIYTPMFAMARVSGWSAHIIEQLANNRLIRPRGLYVGAGPRTVTPLAKR
jgi:2-methylcitrate synthase/citrate synthase II